MIGKMYGDRCGEQMRRRTFQVGILWRLIIVLILVPCLISISSNPTVALSVDDYFSYSYDAEFSKTTIQGDEVFLATIEAEATCTNNLLLPAIEALITGRIIAEHQVSGAKVTLNSSYTVTIKPFPSRKGEVTPVSEVVSLQFPEASQSGTYSVVGELIEAKVEFVGIGWLVLTDYLPSSQTMGSVSYVLGTTGWVGGVPAPPAASLPPGTSDISGFVSDDGVFTETIVAESFDDKCELTIDEGTIGLTEDGEPLNEISIIEMEEPPAPPENSEIIDLTYDLGPDGATFDPPATLTFSYDESLVPEGVAEENLVMAMWDEATGEWVVLVGCIVDPETNTITAKVSHFTAFAILAYTHPAAFGTSELFITPVEVDIGEGVTISTLITNTGDLTGGHEVILEIDNVAVATKDVTLAGGASQTVTFTAVKDVAGTYAVNVDGLSGTFMVKAPPLPLPSKPATFTTSGLTISPTEVDIGESITISALATNTGDLAGSYKVTLKIANVVEATKDITLAGGASQEVTFTAVKDVAGTYAVNVDGQSGTFTVKVAAPPPLPPVKPINWWLIGGIIAGLVIVGLLIYFLVRRQSEP